MAELLTDNHLERLEDLFDEVEESINIISPFLNLQMVNYLCKKTKENNIHCTVVTRTYLQDFIDNVNSVHAIEKLVDHGIEVYSANGLHTKLYIFDNKKAIVGSANFTLGGFNRNIELSLLVDEKETVTKLKDYNDAIIEECDYADDGRVTSAILDKMKKDYNERLSKKLSSGDVYQTEMYGADIGLFNEKDDKEKILEEVSRKESDIVQRFFNKEDRKERGESSHTIWLKFVGKGDDRKDNNDIERLPKVLLNNKEVYVINSSEGFGIGEGDPVFIASLSSDKSGKNQPIIVGRGIMRRFEKNSIAINEWLRDYPWMSTYKYYCVVDYCEMLNAPIKNGIPLLSVINELGNKTYESSYNEDRSFKKIAQAHHQNGHIKLSSDARELIDEWFDGLSDKYEVVRYQSE